MTISVAVLVPTTGRAAQMEERIGALVMQAGVEGVTLDVLLSVPSDDKETIEAAVRVGKLHMPASTKVRLVLRKPGTTAVEGWNSAYRYMESCGGADWYMLGADDLVWHEGWVAGALRVAALTGAQVIGLNDGKTDLAEFAAHYMARAKFCAGELGGHMALPQYRAWWFDREVTQRAMRMGVYAPARDILIEHRHPMWQTAEEDDTYRRGMPHRDADREIYEAWRRS